MPKKRQAVVGEAVTYQIPAPAGEVQLEPGSTSQPSMESVMRPAVECIISLLRSRLRNATLRSRPEQRAFVNRLVRTRMVGGMGARG
jgi:hypothetical protein